MEIKYINRKTNKIEIEKPPGIGWLKFLYDNPFGKKTVLPLAKRKMLTHHYGKKMDKPSSIKKIQPFVDKLGIDLSEAQKSLDEFTTFNDFFYRKLKNSVRPIGDGLVSPGDGRLLAFEKVDEVNQFFIKGNAFTLNEFLLEEKLANHYKNHALLILRLSPSDYHRFHFPFEGIPSETTKIKGRYYSVSPIALANNFTKVFTENKREYALLDTANHGEILIAPVGATMVGTIIETYTPNQKVNKGDEMGYFAFGGSTVMLLVDSNKFKIDQDILDNTKNKLETLVQMGERIAAAL